MHYGLICPDMTGHLNPMTTLGAALRNRGHRVSLIGPPTSRAAAENQGLEFLPVGEPEYQRDIFAAERRKLARMTGLSALRFTGAILCRATAILQRDAPEVMKRASVDAVIWDQVTPGGESSAELLGLPHAMVCNALAIHADEAVPPVITGWKSGPAPWHRYRNRFGNWLIQVAGRPLGREVNLFRRRHGIRPLWHPLVQDGGWIQVAQQPEFFDFPRPGLPPHFHYTGPWHTPDRDADQQFPWEQLDGRPLVYASLGTLQNGLKPMFNRILRACRGLDVQLVLSLGGTRVCLEDSRDSGAVLVDYAPQLQILKRARAVITHAGLNTALEALSQGVPMVAIPIANDQPGVARRLELLGVAEYLSPPTCSVDRIRAALKRVLSRPEYQIAANRCRDRVKASPNVEDAAALLDNALLQQAGCPSGHDASTRKCLG